MQQNAHADHHAPRNYTGNDTSDDVIQMTRHGGSEADIMAYPPQGQADRNCSGQPSCNLEQSKSSGDIVNGIRETRELRTGRKDRPATIQTGQDPNADNDGGNVAVTTSGVVANASSGPEDTGEAGCWTKKMHVDVYRQVAFCLHYVSIVILGVLLLEAGDHSVLSLYRIIFSPCNIVQLVVAWRHDVKHDTDALTI